MQPPQTGRPQLATQQPPTTHISRGFTFIRFPFDTSRLRLTGAPTWPRIHVARFFAYACGVYARTTSTFL
nr:MAG TPA: hypothetical protein [Caudoviricetes sp.]